MQRPVGGKISFFKWPASGFLAAVIILASNPCMAAAVTPTDVFAVADTIDQSADLMLAAKNIRDIIHLRADETSVKPMHVYQMMIVTSDMVIALEEKEGLHPMPRLVSTPRIYLPGDVKIVADLILHETRRMLEVMGIRDEPAPASYYPEKQPTDVFKKMLDVFIKLSFLAGKEAITPSETYQQMVRGGEDVKSILRHIDPARRYRIDAPKSPDGLTPADVFRECLSIREDINRLRDHFGMETIPIPEFKAGSALHPADVFIQTQIIIAELNLLKMRTGTVSATPLAIPVSGKTPRDVHQEAAFIRYLLMQVVPLQDMAAHIRSTTPMNQ